MPDAYLVLSYLIATVPFLNNLIDKRTCINSLFEVLKCLLYLAPKKCFEYQISDQLHASQVFFLRQSVWLQFVKISELVVGCGKQDMKI